MEKIIKTILSTLVFNGISIGLIVAFLYPAFLIYSSLYKVYQISNSDDLPSNINSLNIGDRFYGIATLESKNPVAISMIYTPRAYNSTVTFDRVLKKSFLVSFPSQKHVELELNSMICDPYLEGVFPSLFSYEFQKDMPSFSSKGKFGQILITNERPNINGEKATNYDTLFTVFAILDSVNSNYVIKDTLAIDLIKNQEKGMKKRVVLFDTTFKRSDDNTFLFAFQHRNSFLAEFEVIKLNPLKLKAEFPLLYKNSRSLFQRYWEEAFFFWVIFSILGLFGLLLLFLFLRAKFLLLKNRRNKFK